MKRKQQSAKKSPKKLQSDSAKLHQLAVEARQKAYAPYSKFKVGAAIVTDDGLVFTGSNVENASFGATVCAERNAIFKAVNAGHRKVSQILVVTDAKKAASPCALCLQIMAEFCEPSAVIMVANTEEILFEKTFKELLPIPFGPKDLKP